MEVTKIGPPSFQPFEIQIRVTTPKEQRLLQALTELSIAVPSFMHDNNCISKDEKEVLGDMLDKINCALA